MKFNAKKIAGTSVSGIAMVLAGAFALSVTATPAAATECVLDTNGDGIADGTAGADGSGTDAFACGENAEATALYATAIGNNSRAVAEDAFAAGESAWATAERTTVVGNLAIAQGQNSTAVGWYANTSDSVNATAVGHQAFTSDQATALGSNASAAGNSSVAIGFSAAANQAGAVAIGRGSNAGADATALGTGANAAGTGAVALGSGASASGASAVALGDGASASGANSVAIGAGATATNDGQVVIAGLDTSTAFQSGPVQVVTADANGTLGFASAASAGDVAANTAAITSLQSLTAAQTADINTLFGETAANRAAIDRATEGVALALSMDSPALPEGTNFALSGGIGYYDSKSAGSMAMTARIGQNAAVSAGIGVGFDSGEVGARGGFQFAW